MLEAVDRLTEAVAAEPRIELAMDGTFLSGSDRERRRPVAFDTASCYWLRRLLQVYSRTYNARLPAATLPLLTQGDDGMRSFASVS